MTPSDALPLILPHLSTQATVACMGDGVAEALQTLAPQVQAMTADPSTFNDEAGDANPGQVDAYLLLDGTVADRGITGPVLLAAAINHTRPGGIIAVLVPSKRWHEARGNDRGILAEDLDHALRERGLDVLATYAPGVGAQMAGRPYRGLDDRWIDRTPGLLDAGPWILGIAQTWHTSEERSANFFTSLPQRLAAASAICKHPATGKLLCVFDSFKQHWTLPGGVVDKHESPQEGAIRECLEEAGVEVNSYALGGIFSHSDPDRLHFIYFCEPTGDYSDHPETAHPHEIDAVAWLPLDEARERLAPYMWDKVETCLAHPGQTWPFGVGS